ncbi:MAG: M1 family metallopeptidase [Bacteroidetes bacterium]|nr:M1 family metallopeptidase [Bacteroidota bacterium]
MMNYKYRFLFLIALLSACATPKPATKPEEPSAPIELPVYRSAYTRYVNLIHTKLFLKPIWSKKEMEGTAEITLRQYFYPSDSLILNARGMLIHKVSLIDKNTNPELLFDYQKNELKIYLPRTYQSTDTFTLSIKYTSRPETLPPGGSRAIIKDKGLYFIDADSTDESKPTQLWTQGETESNSAWFPTVESPEQKMTSEIFLNIDTAFTSLSNGLLISSVKNNDGTKTDHWMQDLPMAPYLVMIAVGNFAKVTDHWKGLEVSYYVDPPYEKYARNVFGNTPEMMEFFSNLLNYPYPWAKYSQIVVHDYVSGAMENTTAVVHGTNMQETPREMLDLNYEHYISHELFHHWFGDLVTCRSWSNLTLNEGFANYSEYLWNEYKYGREYADEQMLSDLSSYLRMTERKDPPLIRYQYNDREDMYDAVSYNKGGNILHMLRKYIGDKAFFAGLHLYLKRHEYGATEVEDLRQAFEEVCGEDLHWFFDQWFLKNGFPILKINYKWSSENNTQTISLVQSQDLAKNPLYRLPVDIDFYFGSKITRKQVVMTKQGQDFTFDLASKPDMIIVDPERTLVGKRQDNKSNAEFVYQYYHSPLFMVRMAAVSAIGTHYQLDSPESKMMRDALKDHSSTIRNTAMTHLKKMAEAQPDTLLSTLRDIATNDSLSDNRSLAYSYLATYYPFKSNLEYFQAGLKDSSYDVISEVFKNYAKKDSVSAISIAAELEKDSAVTILVALTDYYSEYSGPYTDKTELFVRALKNAGSWRRYTIVNNYIDYLKQTGSAEIIEKSISILKNTAKKTTNRYLTNTCITALHTGEINLKNQLAAYEQKRDRETKDSAEYTRVQKQCDSITQILNQISQTLDEINKK